MKYDFVIIGAGITAFAIARFLYENGYSFAVSSLGPIGGNFRSFLEKNKIVYEEGRHSQELLSLSREVVISPSVRPQNLPISADKIISEIDLASRFFKGKIIGITGTNGKSTTVSMLSFVLNKLGMRAVSCGNIGIPFISLVNEDVDWAVVELSSFQLFSSVEFVPQVFGILNIKEDHMDWHKDMQEYIDAKVSLIYRMKSGVVFLNGNDSILNSLSFEDANTEIRYFSPIRGFNENESLVISILQFLGFDKGEVIEVLKDFVSLDYRLKYVGEFDGVKFVNDSKATNPASTVFGINELNKKGEKDIILLSGGSSKNSDFSVLKQVKGKVSTVICFGEENHNIYTALKPHFNCVLASDLKSAFEKALSMAREGSVVLLSPMCASFDEFVDYKDRGRYFDELVSQLVCNDRC